MNFMNIDGKYPSPPVPLTVNFENKACASAGAWYASGNTYINCSGGISNAGYVYISFIYDSNARTDT